MRQRDLILGWIYDLFSLSTRREVDVGADVFTVQLRNIDLGKLAVRCLQKRL